MRIVTAECHKAGVNFFTHTHRIPGQKKQSEPLEWSGYADDTVMFFDDTESLQKAIDILNRVFSRFALQINVARKQYPPNDSMIFELPRRR